MKDMLEKVGQARVTKWSEGAEETESPWLAYLSVTNVCNSRCAVCPRHDSMRKERGLMSREVFDRVLDTLPTSIRKIYLMKQGEPLLNKNMPYFLEEIRAKRPDLHVSFHTNGILADEERMAKLLPLVDSMGVSVSAISESAFKAAHGVDNYRDVIKNLGTISRLLEKMGEDRPHVFIDYVRQAANCHEKTEEVVEFFKGLAPFIGSVDFHWVFNFQGKIEQGNMSVYEELPQEKFPCCVFPWSAVTYLHDGNISYCFVEPQENYFLGNIMEEDFESIWNGERYRAFRRGMASKKFDELTKCGMGCAECSWLWSMHSQSPKSLATGYSTDLGMGGANPDFGSLLDGPLEDFIRYGASLYLKGEIQDAVGVLAVADRYCVESSHREAIRELQNRCDAVLAKYDNLALWKKTIEEHDKDHFGKKCEYFKLHPKGM